ncbi:MAG: bifunctional (p)ppGpp synthetase/guanosine-3',5'-bis(diphosphate) 3'-pyrophosphohydrolase [Bacteroidales bacterium]|nr:MAG: bifunctional (p)ppGpp synthetase/guanosine-3',5'-bis(diphosphate) 3'-pyrophosphohydrolase [Bacteroidales bacterium]
MSILTKEEKELIDEKFRDLLEHCQRCKTKVDQDLVRKAFNLAKEAHKNMKRKSGEPYILHPIEVAKIVTYEIGLGAKSIACALMHDVVEDTDYTLEDIENQFGKKIAAIIDGLTKISGVFDNKLSLQAENFRKMLLTLSDDVRVILIKLADRLHNMRTLDSMPHNKQMKVAGETVYLYAPLAHRLGLYAIKTELEDLSLKYHHPKIYEEIQNKIRDNEKRRVTQINRFSFPIIEKLENSGHKFEINGRPKSIASIWSKMQRKGVPFEEVYDLMAIRIIFEPQKGTPEKTQCWNIYSNITDIYMPKPDRIRDWVSTPKANGYEALHTTVMGPDGKWVEVQIRSKRMEEIAERGYAAHWIYKETGSEEGELDKWIRKIREMLENPESNALEFLDEFKMNLFASEIMVFTPKGHIKTLPKDSTALDFAYEIHTEIGNKAIGAKVNYKLVALSHVLNSGDQVEILTSDKQTPQREWLDYAITAKAKSSIKDSLKADTKNRIQKGKKILERKLKEFNLIPSSRIFKKLLPAYDVITKDELYSKIGTGLVTLDDLKKVLRKKSKNKWIRYWELQFGKSSDKKEDENRTNRPEKSEKFDYKTPFILRENIDETSTSYKMAKCCNPIPGDDVIGYRSEIGDLIIHRSKCPKAIKLMSREGDRIVSTKWTTHKILSFLANIRIMGIDRIGMINEITNVISKELNVNMRTVNIEVHDGIFDGTLDLYVHSTKDLNNLIMNLIKIKGVDSVKRIEAPEE